MDTDTRCSYKNVPDGGRAVSQHRCHRNGVVRRDGMWYCKIHDPVWVKAQMDDKRRRWDERWAKRREYEEAREKALIELPVWKCRTERAEDLLRWILERLRDHPDWMTVDGETGQKIRSVLDKVEE